MEVPDIVQETGIKTIPMEKKCQKAKRLSDEDLQIAMKRRDVKGTRELLEQLTECCIYAAVMLHLLLLQCQPLKPTDSSTGKESACNAGDPGLIPGLGRSLGEGSYPLQYSGLENSMDYIVHGVAKSQT